MLTASGSRFDDGLQAGVPLGQDLYTVSRTFNGYSRQHAQVESLRVAYTGEKIQMISVTAHSDYSKALLQDADFMPLDLVKATVDRSDPHWTQEIRVQSRDSASPWRWSGGGFFADSTLHLRFGQIY